MRSLLFPILAVVLTAPLGAQDAELKRPADWKVRFDRAGTPDTAVYFVSMPPGWHITTGPAGILYNPATTASGQFKIESTIFLFDPGQRHREAYGVIFGGQKLDGPDQSYSYFLIRNTGDYLIKKREGASTKTVRDWSPSSAIMKHPGGSENAKNVLAVEVAADAVSFYVNGEKLTSVPKSELQVDGVVGLRVNHSLNLHVSDLKVSR